MQLLFYNGVYVQPIVQNAVLLYGMACKTALEPLESKLTHLVRIICGLRKQDSIRTVRDNQILAVNELQLKEILQLFITVLRS